MLLRIVRGPALLVVGGFIFGGLGPVGVALGLAAGGPVIVGGVFFGWPGGLGVGAVGVAPRAGAGGLVGVGGGGLGGRARAGGLSVEGYLAGNLLGRAVRPQDLADAFVMLARAERTTGAVLPVDGGNIAAAPR